MITLSYFSIAAICMGCLVTGTFVGFLVASLCFISRDSY